MLKLLRIPFDGIKKSQNVRQITTSCFQCKKENSEDNRNKYVTIYHFPYIRALSIVNRLKYYQTGLTMVTIPAATFMNKIGVIDSEGITFTAILGITGCLTLYSLGYFTKKFIGFLYYNEETEVVKVAFINFWGQRKEIEIPKEDIVPLHEVPPKRTDSLYLQLTRFSNNDSFKINVKYGLVADQNIFNKLILHRF